MTLNSDDRETLFEMLLEVSSAKPQVEADLTIRSQIFDSWFWPLIAVKRYRICIQQKNYDLDWRE